VPVQLSAQQPRRTLHNAQATRNSFSNSCNLEAAGTAAAASVGPPSAAAAAEEAGNIEAVVPVDTAAASRRQEAVASCHLTRTVAVRVRTCWPENTPTSETQINHISLMLRYTHGE